MSNTNKYVILTVLLVIIGLSGTMCYTDVLHLKQRSAPAQGQFKILCTFLPMYVFTQNVVGSTPGVSVELMVGPDVGCPHHYTVRPADHMKLARADVVVANGLGMEGFLDQLMKSQPTAKVITISDDCDAIPTRSASDEHEEGTEARRHGGTKEDEHHEEHEHGLMNAHVWVSPTEAIKEVWVLARKLGETDPAHKAEYETNAKAYVTRLEELRDKMLAASKQFKNRKIVTMHDSFDYLAREMNLEVVGYLQVEPDQAPTAHQMAELVDTIKREHVAVVFYDPSAPKRVAETVARDAGVAAYELNPVTSVAGMPKATLYEDIMMKNLETLQKALGGGQ